MSTPAVPSVPNQAPPPPKKKSNVLAWILGGCGVLVLIIVIGALLVMRACKRAGFDSDLMKSNPGYAVAKMAVTANPELEIVSSDDSSGSVTVREKKTGKLTTLKFDPEKKTMVVIDEHGKESSIKVSGEGDKGSMEIKGPDGSVKIGAQAGNDQPNWVPVYPGSSPKGSFSSQTKEGSQNTTTFITKDAPAQVMSLFQEKLKDAGFTITMTTNTAEGGMVMAENTAQKRSVMVAVGNSSEGTSVSVTSVEKK
jgi:hypothetical protein